MHFADKTVGENPSPLWRLIAAQQHNIVPLNDVGGLCPLYLIHSIGGEVTSLREIVRLLGPTIQIYGIQVPRENLRAELPKTIGHVASRYLNLLAEFHEGGPFILGGWSVGAIIALEMAQTLRASETVIPLLVSFDGVLCNTTADLTWRNPRFYLSRGINLGHSVRLALSGGLGVRRTIDKGRIELRRVAGRLRRRARGDDGGHALDRFLDVSGWPKRQAAFARALFDAAMNYSAEPYRGKVVLYTARIRPSFNRAPGAAAWRRVADDLDVIEIDGTHSNLLHAPQVEIVARDLRERLGALGMRVSEAAS